MDFYILTPEKVLNTYFLKLPPNRTQIEVFKENFVRFLDKPNETGFKEFHKNLVKDFLKKTCYEPHHFTIIVKPEIDKLVNEFYGLTEEEMAIEESSSKDGINKKLLNSYTINMTKLK